MKRRVFSFITALALCLNLCPAWAFAAETEEDTGLCPHHTAHTADCGYAEPAAGQPCGHTHTEECYSDGLLPAEGEEKTADACTHVHDDTCGYVPEDPGAPCTFDCRVCPLEELIGALPDRVTADNGEQVGEQLDEIQALYDELTEAEQEQVDLSPCYALMAQFEELDTGELSDVLTGSMIFKGDTKRNTPWVASEHVQVDTDQYTLIYNSGDAKSAAIQVTGTGELEFLGKMVANGSIGIKVESGGSLTVTEKEKEKCTTSISAASNAVYIAAGAKSVKLSAGTYVSTFGYPAIFIEGDNPDYAAVLGDGFAFYDKDGNVLTPDALADTTYASITVGKCTDHNKAYTPDSDAPTHTWTCASCGATGTEEPCSFETWTTGADGKAASTCKDCHREITIDVNQDDLSNLIYDGTLKPQDVRVTVTLDPDASGNGTTLVKDTDFKVVIDSITDAGQATVTVTGLTFTGEFVKTYTVEKATPKIEWSGTTWSVDYDGKEVDNLPAVNITAVPGDDLSSKVRYAYRETGGTDFTEGLPTNAGAYEVKAYLEKSQNYEAAATDSLLELTINKINAVVHAPTATAPTYNRSPQALVTAGELHSVAAAEGLTIEFARTNVGPWSTDLPKETNAGDYEVWYQVTGLTDNYIAPDPNPAQITGVKIDRKAITPKVILSPDSFLYDGGEKQPAVTVKDGDYDLTSLRNIEYTVAYENNRNVSTDDNPAKVIVSDATPNGGNYNIETVKAEFKITKKTQDTLTITKKPDTITYGDQFTLETTGGSGDGLVTWKIVVPDGGSANATVGETSGQVTITGHGSVTVKATKSGTDPATGVVNYEDAIAQWTFTAGKRPVTAVVTADDKTYNGSDAATVHAVVASDDLAFPGDEITIGGLTGTFSDANAGADKNVTVVTTGASITGTNSEHYAVTYSATTVKATIRKEVSSVAQPVPATLTYDGTPQALIPAPETTPTNLPVEYALSEDGPWETGIIPTGINAGNYTVWYRVQETRNYTGTDPESVTATIAKKPVSPTIALDQGSFVYDGTEKKPAVTLSYVDDSNTVEIPADEYTVAYSDNINVGTTATVTVTAKPDGNYTFSDVTENFEITKEQAQVLTAPDAAGDPLTFNNRDQKLVTAGTAEGGTMVYSLDGANFAANIPEGKDAGTYTVHYKVQGDANHSDSDVGQVVVKIIAKTVKDPTIELYEDDGTTSLVSYTYDGQAKQPKVVVKDKDDGAVIGTGEYNIVYSDNTDAGRATVTITDKTDKPNGNYVVSGSTTFVIQKADIVFNPAPTAATLTYNGTAQDLLVPGTTTGGTIYYALGTPTSEYHDYIPTGVDAGTYKVYYKVTGDKNHNDFAFQEVDVTIGRKPLDTPTIKLSPASFSYDGQTHLPEITVKDGDTVLPASEYTWACTDSSGAATQTPTLGGTYTITIADKDGGNYDLSGVVDPNNKKDFTIGKATQPPLEITGLPDEVHYGDTFPLTLTGGNSTGAVTWTVTGGNARIDNNDGNVTVTGVGEITINVVKNGDTNYQQASAHLTFTAARKPVTASVTVDNKPFDNTTTATVTAASITTINSDTVTIDKTSITAAFDDPHAGTGKNVTLDASNVQVTGADANKYAISWPDDVTANITQATTSIDTDPAPIAPLTYNEQSQALVTAGRTNVGFLVYSLDGTNYSQEIPTGTNAGIYTVYYKVDGTADYTGVAANTTPISVTIGPKTVTPKIELSEKSFLYDGTKKDPKVTLKDGNTVIPEDQYTVTWAGPENQPAADLLKAEGTYTATITNVANGNYSFTATDTVEITPAGQTAIHITGKPENVYYGDVIKSLGTDGGTGEGTVTWKITAGNDSAEIVESTGVLTIKGVGSVTVRAERAVPNHATVGESWTFTVEPKPVTAEVTITAKTYDGTTGIADAAITAQVKASDLVNGDTVTINGLKGVYDNANAGTGKTVTLNSTAATADNTDKYTVSYPATATGDIKPKSVTVTFTLSDHDLKTDANGQYYEYDGTEKKTSVAVTGTADDGYSAPLADSDYTVSYSNNKNVSANGVKAAVTVTAKAGGNYTFPDATVPFEIRSAAAVLNSSPQAKNLTYEKGTEQELVTVGAATGGTVVYKLSTADDSDPNVDTGYGTAIPKAENAGTYTVYYKVKGDANHADTAPGQVTVTIKPKEITPNITLDPAAADNPDFYKYTGATITPGVIVKDGAVELPGPGDTNPEYSVSYRDNVNAGTATVTVSDANGGNYIVNGSITFEITKKAPTVTAPEGKTGLTYTGELQDLVTAGVCGEGTVEYSVNGGNYSSAIPTASAVGTYTIDWRVKGDANHSDKAPATLPDVVIDKNTVNDPTITLSQDQFTFDNNQHKPEITVYDNSNRLIPTHEYVLTFAGTNGNTGMVNVDTYTVKVTAAANSNYAFTGDVDRTFTIVPADQETITITGTKRPVYYGDEIPLGIEGGTGSGTVTWKVTDKDGNAITSTISSAGLLTVKDVGGPYTVTVKRTRANYADVTATWEFSSGKKPVTAVLTGVDKPYDSNTNATVKAVVDAGDLVFGDTLTIPDLTGTFDSANAGTNKTITVTGTAPENDKYAITIPATATASILAIPATYTAPEAVDPLTYDATQSQELVTAGTATGGIMVYSLDGTNFTAAVPKAKDAGTYTVSYKAQGDQNHTDSAVGTVNVIINPQPVTTPDIELSPPSGQYDGKVQQPAVTVRDAAHNVIPASEYKVTYVTDGGANWKDKGTYKVRVEDIPGYNYDITTKEVDFVISTSDQAPFVIVNKPGLVYYGDTFTLSATGGSGNGAVTWSVDPVGSSVVEIDANGFVRITGVGQVTIKATKAGGTNYGDATATYSLNALKKPITAIVTAENREYLGGDTSATVHVTWRDGDLINGDRIDTTHIRGTFADDQVGTNKTVTITGEPVDDATSQKYDITIPGTTTASITKAAATAPTLTANDRTYDGSAQGLVTGGDANTLYSDARDGAYSTAVPQKTNAGTYTVWYKEQGDANHSDSQPQSIQVTISPKPLTADATNVELTGNDLQKKDDGTYYYTYDGTDKTPAVIITDGAAVIPASEYKVSYSDNKNVTTAGKEATVTIADSEGGNYTVSGSVKFEIRKGGAQLVTTPAAKNLTYTGAAQELVNVGTATGGHIEYKLSSAPDGETDFDPGTAAFGLTSPTGTAAGTYVVAYKVVGDGNHEDGPTGSVSVTIQPKTVVSPKITVTGTYTYNGSPQTPADGAVTVEDGTTPIDSSEYTLTYRDNTDAGTATVVVTDNSGGNYTVSGTAEFTIGKAAATVTTPPAAKTGLVYTGAPQELITAGEADGGTLVYALSEDGVYSASIPVGQDVREYDIWYMVQGDGNHNNTTPTALLPAVEIAKNTVTHPDIQVTPASVKYTGERQEPAVTVRDDAGLLIDGSEYTVAYLDENSNNDLIQVGIYTLTITEVANGNYIFNVAAGTDPATFEITQADQTALTITGTRERVTYGDTIPLDTTGGIDGGSVAWTVSDGSIADITGAGLLTIKGTGSVTVTATSSKTGYTDKTATWKLYAEKKQVTAVVTAASKTYDGNADADVTATLQASDFVGTDSFTIALTGCTFEDANAGTDKKVNVVSTSPDFTVTAGAADCYKNYAISYPATATASISKADIPADKVTAPTLATRLGYTGLPQALITAQGSAGDGTESYGTMEYSTDNVTYTANLTATDAGDYDVWYRVKGDGNHNDTTPVKMGTQVTIAPQTVAEAGLTIEFNPSGASYDGQVHKPAVTVKDNNNRVIPDSEYTLSYGTSDWKTASSDTVKHQVTVTDKSGGNYQFASKTVEFTISMMGQNPLTIQGQPGAVQYGDRFTLTTTGGSGTGAVSWNSSDTSVADIDQNGLVKVLKSGPATITATKAADANYGAVSVTWPFSAEKKPVTPIVTARNKPFDGTNTAMLDVSWNPGDLLGGDTIQFNPPLIGAFDDANVGENKTVRITGTAPNDDRYAVTIPGTTTASITAQAATVSGVQSGPWTYSGSDLPLLTGGAAQNGTIVYSRDGVNFMETSPTERNAGRYTVYYKARGNTNFADSDVRMVEVIIQPKTVSSPTITLASDSVPYDGNPKEPDVLSVKDGDNVIPASEYTAHYSNNISVGTATVTIQDVAGGNYTVSGSKTFTITAGAASLVNAPQPNNRVYDGTTQPVVTPGTAANGKVVYSESQTGTYSESIPMKADANTYSIWYKVQNADGTDATSPQYLSVTISRKPVTPTILVGGQTSYSTPYTGNPITPAVTVIVDGQMLAAGAYLATPSSNNINPGTVTVTVQNIGGNYQFYVPVTFEITKGKAAFMSGGEPVAKTGLVYTGESQELLELGGIAEDTNSVVVYSLDRTNYSPEIPTAVNRGNYVVYAKVQGGEFYEDSAVVICRVKIDVNTVQNPVVTLPTTNYPYTGNEVKPTVTVTDGDSGNVISADEYTVTYSGNVEIGKATINIKNKTNGNYSFTATATFNIVDASQTPLTITGKPTETIYYGDTLSLGTTGGSGSGAVTWSSSASDVADINASSGAVSIKKAGSAVITATKGSDSDTWTLVAKPRPVTAIVTAADKVYGETYDGGQTVKLTVTLSGLVGGDRVDSVTATGSFADENAGTDKTVHITGLNGLDGISDKYTVTTWNTTATATIHPKPASVTGSVTGKLSLTYKAAPQELVNIAGVTEVEGGSLAYSLGNSSSFDFNVPTATDVGSYTVYYKVVADGTGNYRDSAVGSVTATISQNPNTPQVQCRPATLPYNGTAQAPDVEVLDNNGNLLPESEYTVELPTDAIKVGRYTVKVTDRRPGAGNYEFSTPAEGTFEIVQASQNHLTIDTTGVPTTVIYGEQLRLNVTGYSGDGAIHWSVTSDTGAAAITSASGDYCIVTVKGTGSFTVEAYQAETDSCGKSNTDSVPFVAQPKPVTPVVAANDKPYDGTATATFAAPYLNSGDLVNSTDEVILTVSGVFASAGAGAGRRVNLTTRTVSGADAAKYTVNWPEYVTANIDRTNAQFNIQPAAKSGLVADGTTAYELVNAGTTVNNIGTVAYSLNDQNGTYTSAIPTATAAGTYRVWYQIADSVNYYGVAPAYVDVTIAPASSNNAINRAPASPPPAQTTVENGTATTVVSASDGSALVQEAVDNQSESVVIQSDAASDAAGAAVSIPVETVSQIRNETNAALTVSTPIADVTIPNAGLDTLSGQEGAEDGQTGTVNVTVIRQESGAVELTLVGADGKTVSEVPGGVTLAVPVEDAAPGTVAVLVREDGTSEVIQKSVAKDGTVLVPLDGSATVKLVDNSKTFGDVTPDTEWAWAADAVAFASARELFIGTGEDTFEPDTKMSRSMLAEVLYRLEGSPDQETTGGFSDVDSGDWCAASAAWAVAKGITDANGSSFQPNKAVTRGQFALMLWNYAGQPETGGGDAGSSDAQKALLWATEKGILIGRSAEAQQIDPDDEVTRAEAAQMVKNFLEKI